MTAMTIHTHRTTTSSPAERGRECGTTWSSQIRAAVAEYQQHFRTVGIDADTVRRVSESAGHVGRTTVPHLTEEIEQIAAGADLPPWQVMMLNARTEILALAPPAQECSATVFWPAGGIPHTMQTWDWRPGLATESLVSAFPTAEASSQVVTFAEFGQVGKIGVNSHGLGLHFNILRHRSDGSRSGTPVHVAARHILEVATTVSEAIEVARSLTFGASSVFTLASRSGHLRAACVEVTPVGVGVVEGGEGAALNHTNHFLDPELASGAQPAASGSTSGLRLEYLDGQSQALSIAEPLQRIAALHRAPEMAICVRRTPGVPAHEDSVTKATIALDLVTPALGIHSGGPRDVQPDTWQTITV